jgi:hypothetical protein
LFHVETLAHLGRVSKKKVQGRGVQLSLVIPGPFVSGNHAKTRDGRRTTESRAFDEKVAVLARLAAREQAWRMPAFVRGMVVLIGLRMDWDNACKELMDPLQGIVFPYDSRLVDVRVVSIRVRGRPQEARLTFRPADGRRYYWRRGLTPSIPPFHEEQGDVHAFSTEILTGANPQGAMPVV